MNDYYQTYVFKYVERGPEYPQSQITAEMDGLCTATDLILAFVRFMGACGYAEASIKNGLNDAMDELFPDDEDDDDLELDDADEADDDDGCEPDWKMIWKKGDDR